MKHWGLFSTFLNTLRHNHLPHVLHFTDPRMVLFAAGALAGVLLYFSGIFLLVPNLVTILWPWKIHNFFSSSFSHLYLIHDISWLTAFKMTIFLAVLWMIFKGIKSDRQD
jgi:hypothetical protein